jgi:magnesium transporter
MPYVSDFIGRPVVDVDGKKIGKLKDLLASRTSDGSHPQIVALEIRGDRGIIFTPIESVAALVSLAIPLTMRKSEIKIYQTSEGDLFLIRDVLDKQIIDTNGMRVVRVNDLELTRVNSHIIISNVDISGASLVRRLGFSRLADRLASRRIRSDLPQNISWDFVELLPGDQPLRLKVPGSKMNELHPADIAEIISDLSRQEGSRFLENLDNETLADTLEEVEPEFQASLIEALPDERLADVLEEMDPDEAADLLAELPEDRSHELLELMGDEDAKDVRKLLAYPEDSAGGIMNTDFYAITADQTALQVMEQMRTLLPEAESLDYVYVIDNESHLIGVFSLRKLVLSDPSAMVKDFMEKRVVTVNLLDSQEECAQVVAKYNLIAVPVVDEEKCIHGIVTADDALDKIIPTAWKKRLPRFYQ